MSFREFLKEDAAFQKISKGKKGKWIKVKSSEFGSDLSGEFFELITQTYKHIGGHSNFKKKGDLPGKDVDWKAIDIDADPEADIIVGSKTKVGGTKGVVIATDGSKKAKEEMLKSKVKDLNTQGNYAEVSEGIAHVLITKFIVPFVDNLEDVQKVLSGKVIKWVGLNPNGKYPKHPWWYERTLAGEKHLKIMVGKPKI